MKPAIFPERHIWTVSETGTAAQEALVRWALGSSFHHYGTLRHDQPNYEYREEGARVEFSSSIDWYGKLRWRVSYARSGERDSHGLCSGYSSPEDAAYSACSVIEEYEREVYEERLVVGVA